MDTICRSSHRGRRCFSPPPRSLLLLLLLLLGTYAASAPSAPSFGYIRYVAPPPGSVTTSRDISLGTQILLSGGGEEFLQRCGGLLGYPEKQAADSVGCMLHVAQVDCTGGGAGISLDVTAYRDRLPARLDARLCKPSEFGLLMCSITVHVTEVGSGRVVLASENPTEPLVVYLSDHGQKGAGKAADDEMKLRQQGVYKMMGPEGHWAAAAEEIRANCLPALPPESFSGTPDDAEWQRHYEEVLRASEQLRKVRSSVDYAGLSGDCLESAWIDSLCCDKPRKIFGVFIPIFVPWLELGDSMRRRGIIRRTVTRDSDAMDIPAALRALHAVLRPEYIYITVAVADLGLQWVSNRTRRDGQLEAVIDFMEAVPNLVVLSAGGFGHVPLPLLPPESEGDEDIESPRLPVWPPGSCTLRQYLFFCFDAFRWITLTFHPRALNQTHPTWSRLLEP